MFLYTCSHNKLVVVQVDDQTGDLTQTVQTIDPIVDPLPPNYPPPSAWFKSFHSPATEWIVRHPKFNLLYAFTSFWSDHPAYITTFQIHPLNGTLTKLGECVESGGLHVPHATFSPDSSLLVVCHHNDGKIAFFECGKDGTALDGPIKVVDTPEVRPGTRTSEFPGLLPSLQHVCYAPNGQYLLTVDSSSQSRIRTYPVDERGMVTSDTPTYEHKLAAIQENPGILSAMIAQHVMQSPNRLRRVAIHPNGSYVYVLFESHSLIQVFEITPDGKIIADCLQEIPSIDPSYFDKSAWRFVGAASNAAGELTATTHGVLVSNRGFKVAGSSENSVRYFGYGDTKGSRLVPRQMLETAGPVRHFCADTTGSRLHVGINQEKPGIVETFAQHYDGTYSKTGQANVGMDVFCVVAIPEHRIDA